VRQVTAYGDPQSDKNLRRNQPARFDDVEVTAGELLTGSRFRPDVAAGATGLDRPAFDNEHVVDLPAQCNREWVLSREEMEENSSLARAWLALRHKKTISIYSAAGRSVLPVIARASLSSSDQIATADY
jgi:hypothetical protein